MSKIRVLGAAFIVVLAFSAVAAAGAYAHEWLTLSGAKVTTKEPSKTVGTIFLKTTKISSLLGGGEVEVECDGIFVGTVGPGAEDEITSATNLSGGEVNKVTCKVIKSTNSFCKTTNSAVLTPVNLPWKTLLVSNGTLVEDELGTTVGKGVGYSVSCNGLSNECARKEEFSKLLQNGAKGAEFAFERGLVATCTSGEGTAKGGGTVEGFLAN